VADQPDESDQQAIRRQLETLVRRGERLKGYNIALEVFDRPETFDPVVDPLVRTEAARLREKLREHYDTEGQSDSIRIDLPKGTYTPKLNFGRLKNQMMSWLPSPVRPRLARDIGGGRHNFSFRSAACWFRPLEVAKFSRSIV
jgi:hypothetical protein